MEYEEINLKEEIKDIYSELFYIRTNEKKYLRFVDNGINTFFGFNMHCVDDGKYFRKYLCNGKDCKRCVYNKAVPSIFLPVVICDEYGRVDNKNNKIKIWEIPNKKIYIRINEIDKEIKKDLKNYMIIISKIDKYNMDIVHVADYNNIDMPDYIWEESIQKYWKEYIIRIYNGN